MKFKIGSPDEKIDPLLRSLRWVSAVHDSAKTLFFGFPIIACIVAVVDGWAEFAHGTSIEPFRTRYVVICSITWGALYFLQRIAGDVRINLIRKLMKLEMGHAGHAN